MPFGHERCLAASMTWTAQDSGDQNAECHRTLLGAQCYAAAVFLKSVKIVLASPDGGKPVAETTASIRSSYSGFSRESFHALCMAAFQEYPHPLSNEQFKVPVE